MRHIPASAAFLEECVIGGVWDGLKRTGGLAWPLGNAALGVESLDRCDSREFAGSALRGHFELEQGDVLRRRARRPPADLAGNAAAVGQFPVWTREVPADRLSINLNSWTSEKLS